MTAHGHQTEAVVDAVVGVGDTNPLGYYELDQ